MSTKTSPGKILSRIVSPYAKFDYFKVYSDRRTDGSMRYKACCFFDMSDELNVQTSKIYVKLIEELNEALENHEWNGFKYQAYLYQPIIGARKGVWTIALKSKDIPLTNRQKTILSIARQLASV